MADVEQGPVQTVEGEETVSTAVTVQGAYELMTPEMIRKGAEMAKELFRAIDSVIADIMTESDYTHAKGNKKLNKDGALKGITAFRLEEEYVSSEIKKPEEGVIEGEVVIKMGFPGGYPNAVGIGRCSNQEKDGRGVKTRLNDPEHVILSMAHTRAKIRAVEQLLMGGKSSKSGQQGRSGQSGGQSRGQSNQQNRSETQSRSEGQPQNTEAKTPGQELANLLKQARDKNMIEQVRYQDGLKWASNKNTPVKDIEAQIKSWKEKLGIK